MGKQQVSNFVSWNMCPHCFTCCTTMLFYCSSVLC